MTPDQFNAIAAPALGATTAMCLGGWMLAAWRLRKVRRAKLGERTAPAGLAANALPLTAAERQDLNAQFMWTVRGVRAR